jgi:hypothetical protein
MKKKLLMLAGMLGVCACSLFVRPAQALLTFPTCGPSYCPSHLSSICSCPPGSKDYPHNAPCDTWHADCNFL